MADSQEATVIGPDTVIKGEMAVENRAKILGRFEGTIKAKGQIEVANKAQCEADVEAVTVQIDGGMQGNITASDKVQLNATAKMIGDLVTAKLVVAEGAAVRGHFTVGPDAVKNSGSSSASSSSSAATPDVVVKPKDSSQSQSKK